MRWPWSKPETRESGGGYTEIISRLVEAQSAGTTQQVSATAATEAVAGALSRAFAGAVVEGPPDVVAALSPRCMAQIGRDLVRVGESLHVIRMTGGRLRLHPAATWYWWGDADPDTWQVTATVYGPSGSTTWRVPFASTLFVTWGSPTARPYHGLSPGSWAADTATLHANAERSLKYEAGAPSAQIIPIPQDGGDGGDDDPLASLKADLKNAKGAAMLVETVAGGWGEGKAAAPLGDWKQSRIGPMPTAELVKLAESSFARSLAASGAPPGLFAEGTDGTGMRESLRQWHMGTVRPLARILETEASEKFGSPVTLKFDGYPMDMVSRAQVFAKLAAAEGVSPALALELSGMMED